MFPDKGFFCMNVRLVMNKYVIHSSKSFVDLFIGSFILLFYFIYFHFHLTNMNTKYSTK